MIKPEREGQLKKWNKCTNLRKKIKDSTCRGELTTIKELSKGVAKGFAFVVKTIQPNGFHGETVTVEENKLVSSTEFLVLSSYTLTV